MVRAAEDQTLNMCAAIERIILNIPDGVDSDIIHMRYIEFETWDKIAEKTGYSEKHVYRIHNRILEKLTFHNMPPPFKNCKNKNRSDRRPTFLYKIFPHRNFKT